MKRTWIRFMMVFGLILSMTASSIYAAEDSKQGRLQEMLRKASGKEDVELQDEMESGDTEEEFTEEPGRTTPGPETVDVGDFIVDVPEGWSGFREPMGVWDQDAMGEFFPDSFSLVKGGETSQDIQKGNFGTRSLTIWKPLLHEFAGCCKFRKVNRKDSLRRQPGWIGHCHIISGGET